MCLLEMIILCPFLTGMTGAEVTRVFSSSGENVSLPCNNALSDCTSTTWIYNSRHSVTVELTAGGEVKNDIERRERLSLGSDCSLKIKKVTQEDYGLYSCQQYENGSGPKQGSDAPVYLHVLHVSSSSSQTEIRSGSVTLSCQLYSYEDSCDSLFTEGFQMIWVNQAGVSVMTDSRYQILFSSTHCISTLTTTILNEDHNREWRCQVTQRNQLKTSATFTVKYSAPTETKTLTPVTSSKTTTTVNKPVTSTQPAPTPPEELVIVMVVVAAALAVLLPAVILWVVCKKRGDNYSSDIRRGTNDSLVTNMNKYNGTNDTINIPIHPTASANEQKDVIYTEIATYSKNQGKNHKVHDDDKVTYASIRGETAGPQENCSQLYPSVNKNRHK